MPDTLLTKYRPAGTRLGVGDVDPIQPLDWTHPLLRGVQGFWLPLPHLTGGSRLYDLSGQGRHFEAQNIGNISGRWTVDSQGFGAVALDGTEDHFLLSDDIAPSTVTVASLFWTDHSEDQRVFNKYQSLSDAWGVKVNTAGEVYIYDDIDGVDNTYYNTSFVAGEEVLVVAQLRAGNENVMWVDGNLVGSGTTSSSGIDSFSSSWYIGQRGNSSEHLNGAHGWHAIWSSEKDGAAIYEQFRRGFPDLLRRRTSVYPLSGAAAGQDLVRVVDETEQTTEATIASRALARIRNETTQISEAFLRPRALSRITTETAEVSETLVPSRSLLRVISETQNIQEGVVRIVRLLEVVDETVQVSETLARTRSLGRVVDETVEVSEVLVRPRTLARIVSETTQVSEGLIQSLGLLRTQSETVQISESTLRLIALLQVVDETVQVSESLAQSLSLNRVVDETLEITEGILSPRALVRVADETLQVSEGLVNVVRAITEGALTGTLELKARLTNSATELKERLSGFLNIEEK